MKELVQLNTKLTESICGFKPAYRVENYKCGFHLPRVTNVSKFIGYSLFVFIYSLFVSAMLDETIKSINEYKESSARLDKLIESLKN
jgi:hypothetical protein